MLWKNKYSYFFKLQYYFAFLQPWFFWQFLKINKLKTEEIKRLIDKQDGKYISNIDTYENKYK